MTREHIKSEKEQVSEIEKGKIKVENDLDSKEFIVIPVFIKDEYGQCIGSDASDTVSDRIYNASTISNFGPTVMRFDVASDGVLKMQEEIDSQNTTTEYDFTKSPIKSEAVGELKLENDLETCGISEITEEYIIKDENDHIMKNPIAEGRHKHHVCIHCNATFKYKINLDDHIIKKHPEYIISVSSKIHECIHCNYKTTLKKEFTRHMFTHPDADTCYRLSVCIHCDRTFRNKSNLDDHTIKKHPEYITSVSSKIHACQYCLFKTISTTHLSKHMGKHTGAGVSCQPKTCIYCNTTFKHKPNLDDHIIKKHPEYIESVSSKVHECTYCSYKTTFKDMFCRHILKHPGADISYKPNVCIHCNTTLTSKVNLDYHIIKKHPEYIASVSSKIHECIYCTYKTTAKNKLASHMLKHSDAEKNIG